MRPFAIALTTVAIALAVSGAAPAQSRRDRATTSAGSRGGDSSGGGRATPRGGGDSGNHASSAPPPTSSGSSGSAGSASGDSKQTPTTQRRGGNSPDGAGRGSRERARPTSSDAGSSGAGGDAVAVRRPRDGRPVKGEAVERRPGSGGGGTTVVVGDGYYAGGYYPWGYGGLGLGGYYGGLYDPWWYDDNPYAGRSGYGDEGSLRLKIKPRDASVYVDGYFAGRVDDYDGVFQRLTVESGPHRIEVRADAFEPLMFEVRILPDRTIIYTGELKAIP